MFQKRHFEVLASILADIWGVEEEMTDIGLERFTEEIGRFNPNFNLERFLRACGYPRD